MSVGADRTGWHRLSLGALGVVFGDIGTSPLYALQTVFTADNGAVHTSPGEVYGVISLIFWSITLIVSVKYIGFIMRADNHGEGGVIALTALVESARLKSAKVKGTLVALGILGASLFYGDGVITPAISVMSAAGGLEVASPAMAPWVLPLSLAVLTGLFAVQRYGTGLVGGLFGPVMLVWFTVLGVLGIKEVIRHPDVLRALSPSYGVQFFVDHGVVAFIALASVVLAVTGAEALYADMGHFGRAPISRAWFLLVFPALTLNYLGQGSLILRAPSAIDNPFYLLVPAEAQIPVVVLATAATVIASQAVISGAFSVTRQAVRMGYLPWMTIRHTSDDEEGQVYVPAVNTWLYVAVSAVVLGFGSAAALASAYGVAVTGTFILNTCLFLAVARTRWHTRRRMIALGATVFLSVEVAFFSATLTKVEHGGWLPLAIGIAIFTVMMTWRRGMRIMAEERGRRHGSINDFVLTLATSAPPVQRAPGAAVFLNSDPDTAPPALLVNVEHNHVLHRRTVILTIQTERLPHVPRKERLTARHIGDSQLCVTQLIAHFGYQDHPNVPATLRLAVSQGLLRRVDMDEVSYFLSRNRLELTDTANMNRWRKRLFLTMVHNAASRAEHFQLPPDRTLAMGEEVEI